MKPPTKLAIVIPIQKPPLDLLANASSAFMSASIASTFFSRDSTVEMSRPYSTGSTFMTLLSQQVMDHYHQPATASIPDSQYWLDRMG